jgi:hypothetical protein
MLTGRNAAQPRSRAPPARWAFCRPGCAARCAPATTSPRRPCRTVPLPRAAGSPPRRPSRNASRRIGPGATPYGELHTTQRSLVGASAHADGRPSPYQSIDAGCTVYRRRVRAIRTARRPARARRCSPASCPRACSRGRPPLALLAAVQCRPAAPHGLLYPPAPPRPLPGRSTAEPKAFRGQAPGHRRPAITGGFPTRLRPQIGEW